MACRGGVGARRRADAVVAVVDEARDRFALEPGAASAGQGGALSRRVAAGADAAGNATTLCAAMVDEFRWEHNHLRPHEALGMVTSASRWEGEQQALRSAACGVGVPCWRLGAEGGLRGQARRGRTQVADQSSSERRTGAVAPARGAHAGVLLQTLFRELDFGIQRSTIVERWIPDQAPHQKP